MHACRWAADEWRLAEEQEATILKGLETLLAGCEEQRISPSYDCQRQELPSENVAVES
jgi:hypothetical protein